MITSGIYSVTNIVTCKAYIGSTQDFNQRWIEHRSELQRNVHGNSHLQHSWNKYGESAFEFGILEYLDNLDELVKAEQFWMDVYREEGKELYNFGLAADNPMRGRKHTEETKHKMSVISQNCSEETRRKIGIASAGRTVSEETRHRMSIYASNRSEEHKNNWSKARVGHPVSEETRQKLRDANLGKTLSEEHKLKIGKASKAYWAKVKETSCPKTGSTT